MAVQVNLPAIITACDYHEFDSHRTIIQKIMGKKVKVKEISAECYDSADLPGGHYYAAIVYIGKLPKKADIDRMITEL